MLYTYFQGKNAIFPCFNFTVICKLIWIIKVQIMKIKDDNIHKSDALNHILGQHVQFHYLIIRISMFKSKQSCTFTGYCLRTYLILDYRDVLLITLYLRNQINKIIVLCKKFCHKCLQYQPGLNGPTAFLLMLKTLLSFLSRT